MNQPKSEREKIKKTTKKTTTRILEEIAKAEGIIGAIGEGINIIDRTFRIIYQNQVHRDMMGDHVGEYCYKAYEKKQGICNGCPVALTFKNGKVHTVQRERQTDKGIRYTEITSSSLKDSTGKIIAGVEVIRNITECKQIEKTLRESEDKFRTLAETNEAAIVILQEDKFLYVNPATAALTGYKKEELMKSRFVDFIHPEFQDLIKEREIARQHGKKVSTASEFKIITKSGDIKWVTTTGGLIEYHGMPAVIGTAFDITERKRLEEQLLQAQKMESVGQLAGGIAHDFNNLLTAIIGYGILLKTEVGQNDLSLSYVTQILKSAEKAANLTHNLLAFSRRQMIKPRPVNMNNVINSIKSFLPRIIGEDIEISIFSTDKDLTVMADKHQIEQVLMNLVTNARDAMPDGGNLIIRTESSELDNEFKKKHGYGSTGPYSLISVEDTGQGMDEETKERLFDPFFTTKEVGKGTGLGLSMAYGIIKQHNGFIDVQSEHGKGATFTIYLPLTTLTVEEDKKPEDLPLIKGGNEKILVVEDETYVRDFIKEILTGYGYKVLEAMDGEDALKVFHNNKDKIQLAMLDVVMPKKDGKKVYEEIKKVNPHIKVIFMSGYATDILYKRGIIEEDINFISKPMSPGELLKKVREVLDS